TAGISIGSISEGMAGVFTVNVTATSAGTVQLRVPMGATLSDAAGNPLDTNSAIIDDTTINVDASTVVVTPQNSLGTAFTATLWASNLSASDLINAGELTLEASTISPEFFGPTGTNDGASEIGSGTNTFFAAADNFPATAIYDLDLTTNTAGYDLTSIESFMGWTANSSTHANQTYQVEVSFVGSPDYVLLAVVNYEPFGTANSDNHESHVVIDDSSGRLASGVDSIRFTFRAPEIGGTAPGTVVREIDVFGTPSTGGAAAITAIHYDHNVGSVTLTWRKTNATSYVVKYSFDLDNWDSDLEDSVTATRDENPGDTDHLTVTFPLTGELQNTPKLFFRIEE
ncbi:MAG: hypothetical protein ABF380_09230, partial [Akkermansiaceae bacterium]